MELKSLAEVVSRAERDAERMSGRVALEQTIDVDASEVLAVPVIVARHGELPAE